MTVNHAVMSDLLINVTSFCSSGDFQWPKMKLSAKEWHENTKHWLTPDDDHALYIATDETDRSWFGE